MQGGIFFDRDGVINHPPPPERRYVTRPEEFHLLPGTAEAIRFCNQQGIPVGVITNQKGIALGRYSVGDLELIHARMRELLQAEGATVQDIQFCPHQESDECSCRKPLPGMLIEGARRLQVDLSRSWMIGDQPRDLVAGRAAGCYTLGVGSAAFPEDCTDVTLKNTTQLASWFNEHFPFQKEIEQA